MPMGQVNIPEEMEGSIKLYKGTGMSILSHSDSVLDLNDIVLIFKRQNTMLNQLYSSIVMEPS